MVGAVAAQVAMSGVPGRTLIILLAAALLGLVGVVDDRKNLHPRLLLRLGALLLAAGVALTVGVRVNITGNDVVDGAATVAWIVVMTYAVNCLDNMDGLAVGVAATSAASAFVLASAAGQTVVAAAAGALVAACVGFLLYNRRPAKIYLGDGASLFLGFLLAVVVNQVDPAQSPPQTWIVPALLLGIPLLDITTVMLARWRNGRTLYLGGRDHLSHRLVAPGWSRRNAVLTLVGCQALLGGSAMLIGLAFLPLWAGIGLSAAVVGPLLLLCLTSRVYQPPLMT